MCLVDLQSRLAALKRKGWAEAQQAFAMSGIRPEITQVAARRGSSRYKISFIRYRCTRKSLSRHQAPNKERLCVIRIILKTTARSLTPKAS